MAPIQIIIQSTSNGKPGGSQAVQGGLDVPSGATGLTLVAHRIQARIGNHHKSINS